MKATQLVTIISSIAIAWSAIVEGAAPAPILRYQGVGEFPGLPYGKILPLAGGAGFELTAYGPAPVAPSWGGSRYLARLSDRGDFLWGLTTYAGKYGGHELHAHPTKPVAFVRLQGLVDEEFWSVFGWFDGQTGTRLFERGFRATVNKKSENTFIPSPSSRVDFLPEGKIAFIVNDWVNQPFGPRAAVFGETGAPVWQKVFLSPTFKDKNASAVSLVHDSKEGFWCIMAGHPVNPADSNSLPQDLIRLDSEGKVLSKRRIIRSPARYLESSYVAWAIPNPADGLLICELVEPFSAPPPGSAPKITAYLMNCDRDGRLLWTRSFSNIASVWSRLFGPDASTLYLTTSKIVSLTPLPKLETWLVKLDAKSGEIQRSIKIGQPASTVTEVVGVTDQKVYVQRTEFGTGQTGFVGAFDTDLRNGTWRKYIRDDMKERWTTAYDASTDRLFVGIATISAGWVDWITLNGSLQVEGLKPANSGSAPCELFADATLPVSEDTPSNESVTLAQGDSDVEVRDTTIELTPSTRLEVKPFQMKTGNPCQPAAGAPAKPSLQIKPKGSGGGFGLSFPTQPGLSYQLLHAESLDRTFEVMVSLTGDGDLKEYTLNAGPSSGFYLVRVDSF